VHEKAEIVTITKSIPKAQKKYQKLNIYKLPFTHNIHEELLHHIYVYAHTTLTISRPPQNTL
jgi:hypothetical protein